MGRMRQTWLLLGMMVLAGCADLTGFGSGAPQITRLALFDGGAVAAGPQGYCIAPLVSRPADGFVVLARCDLIAATGDAGAAEGFVTVQLGDIGTTLGSESAGLPAFLRSDAGRSLLSQAGASDDITVQAAGVAAGGATVRFLDRAPPPVTGLQQTEWRGFVDVAGRLATVSVRGLDAAPLGTDEGQSLLERTMLALQQANAASPLTGQ